MNSKSMNKFNNIIVSRNCINYLSLIFNCQCVQLELVGITQTISEYKLTLILFSSKTTRIITQLLSMMCLKMEVSKFIKNILTFIKYLKTSIYLLKILLEKLPQKTFILLYTNTVATEIYLFWQILMIKLWAKIHSNYSMLFI